MGVDGTATPAVADPDAVRNQVVADTIKIVSTSLLGLSVGCAQCHDHRYDPIPQTDYYRIRAVIEPAYDPKNWRTPDQRLLSLYTDADRKKAAEVEAEAKKLAEEKETKQKQYIEEALTKHLEKFEASLREPLRAAYDTPADKRTAEQKKLLADNPSVNINAGVLYQYNQKAADDLKAMDAKIAEVRGRKPTEDFISPLTEPADKVPVTHVFHRVDPKQPKDDPDHVTRDNIPEKYGYWLRAAVARVVVAEAVRQQDVRTGREHERHVRDIGTAGARGAVLQSAFELRDAAP